jgi:hypothetical protein
MLPFFLQYLTDIGDLKGGNPTSRIGELMANNLPTPKVLHVFKKSTKKRKPDGYLVTNQCPQIRTRIGSSNVRTLFHKVKLAQLIREMEDINWISFE